jgi:iron complex outermembrane receptor protein
MTQGNSFRRLRVKSGLLCSTMSAGFLIFAQPALAQLQGPAPADPSATVQTGSAQSVTGDRVLAANDTEADDIVVTGSSIRGVPPTGSNLIQLGVQEVITTGASTVQELLANVPQLGTFNQAPRPDPHSNGILSTAPNIRGIGQAQTLVLVNGHRLVGVGHLQNIPDPSIIPTSALQRVEIVADGASSVYGSDGIAGVVNLITLRDYDGAAATFRYGLGDSYDLLNTNAVIGTKWNGGGVVASVEYSRTSRLEGSDRDYVTNDYRSFGGIDNRTANNCVPSSFRLQNANGVATGDFIEFGTGNRNVRCDNSQFTDLYPKQERLSFFAAGHQDIGEGAEIFFDAFHSKTTSDANLAPAGASGSITRANPFFPTAQVAADVNRVTALYNVSNITGVRLKDVQDVIVYGGTIGTGIDVFDDFRWTTYLTGSRSSTDLHEGSFSPVVNAAAIAGTTPATALDPFTGLTSNSIKIGLAAYEQRFASKQYIWELNSKIDGPLFHIPGGDVKIAIGGVYRRENYDGINTLSRIGFLENLGAQVGKRTVYSGFGELFIPIFSEENGAPGARRLDISLSARYDNYNDFGSTTNPKVGVNWMPFEGFTFRGSYGTSFHAPALPDLFGPDTRAGYGTGGLTPAGLATRTGSIFIAGGNPNLDAEKATTWSLGFDFAPPSISGLRASVTYYNVAFSGRIAFPQSAFFYIDPAFNPYFVDNVQCTSGTYPGGQGCASLPIDPSIVFELIKGLRLQNFPAPVNGAADIPPVFIVSILRRQNLAEIDTTGLDFDASYRWTMGFGSMGVQVQGNRILVYDQRAIAGAPRVSQFSFGQAKFRARGSVSAQAGPVQATVMVNYNDKYKNRYLQPSGTTSVQAIETIKAFTTVDLHLGYDLPARGVLAGTQLTLDVDNTFDKDPPRARSGFGYGVGNVLGRVITAGIRKKF